MVSDNKKRTLRALGMDEQVNRIERGQCPICGQPAKKEDCRDALSKKEFDISGMCQKCQNETFKQ